MKQARTLKEQQPIVDPKQIEKEIDQIERGIGLLKREYEIYFAGGAKLPPNDSRDKLDRAIKRIGALQGLNYALRFRYSSLVARFNSYQDLWNKQLRAKEEGRQEGRQSQKGRQKTQDQQQPNG